MRGEIDEAPQHPCLRAGADCLTLEEAVQGLTERVAKTEDGIAAARKRLTGTFAQKGEYEDMRATLNQMIADKPILEQKLGAAKSTLSACKAWLNNCRGYGAGTGSR